MVRISYVNGNFVDHDQATVHVEDRGYQFSDGVYEVVLIKQGIVIDWALHIERLKRSLNGLKIAYDVDAEAIGAILEKLLAENNLTNVDATLYLQISRGAAKRDHAFPESSVAPSLVMVVSPFSPVSKEVYQQGAKAITCSDLRWKRRDYKTISLLPNVLAKQQAIEEDAVEAIFIEEDGVVTEASASNVFIVDKRGVLKTHPATHSILNGITRLGVLQVAKEQAIAVEEKSFSKQELLDAEEVFITSTTKHILPIVTIGEVAIASGKVGDLTLRLIDAYQGYIARQVVSK